MALSGKKITELNPISDVTNKTVLPAVYVDDTYTEATATKVTVQQLKNNILNGAVLQPNIITDTESTSIELNKILANTIYQYGTLSSLSITTFDTSYQDSYIYFKTSENGFNFSFSTANWINLYEPTFKLNTDYIIHLKNGVCVLEQPENPILNITATSGNIALRTNTVNSMSISGNTTFVLPQTVNNNILNKIILQIKITGTPTIDWGTTHYLADSFTLTSGTYDIIYEYDSLNNYWKVGLLYSTGGGGGDVPSNVYTQDNLVAGTNISITEVPQSVIDANTVELYHCNGDMIDAIANHEWTTSANQNKYIYPEGKFAQGVRKTQAYDDAGNPLNSFDYNVPATIDFWICRIDTSVYMGFKTVGGGDWNFYGTYVRANNTTINYPSGITLGINEWHHIAIVNDGAGQSTSEKYYIDGKLAGSKANNGSFGLNAIGQGGIVDEIRVSNVARWTADFTPFSQPYQEASGNPVYQINNTQSVPEHLGIGYDATKTQVLKNVNGTLTWVDE